MNLDGIIMIFDKASKVLFPNGYLDAVTGKNARVNITQSIRGFGSLDENATSVNTAWFANGLIWNDEKQEYVSVAKVADKILNI